MKIFIETLGCEKNTADSESAAGILCRGGHELVSAPEEADAVMVNTCGFINDAKEESIDRIFDMVQRKKEDALLIVSGCLAQRYGEALFKEMPEVDIFLGVNDYPRLPEILAKHQMGKREKYLSAYDKTYIETGLRRRTGGQNYTASIKIAEGCDNVCSYCVIPAIRGPYRSRRREDIVAEAKQLAAEGCRELIVIAQDTSAYGLDLYGRLCLPELLRDLCAVDEIRWIRLMYCYEDKITDDLISVMASQEKICRYIDIPIQHASDRVLSAMNRHSTRASVTDTVARLRKAMPDIHIRTTLIAGLPGETAEDFEILCDFVEQMRFERLGVFAYSREEGTPAAAMKGQVREQTKQKRRETIMAMQCGISLEKNREMIGKTIEVLVEERDGENSYIGRSRYDAPEIDNSVIFTARRELQPGEFVNVRVTDAFDYDLAGELI